MECPELGLNEMPHFRNEREKRGIPGYCRTTLGDAGRAFTRPARLTPVYWIAAMLVFGLPDCSGAFCAFGDCGNAGVGQCLSTALAGWSWLCLKGSGAASFCRSRASFMRCICWGWRPHSVCLSAGWPKSSGF